MPKNQIKKPPDQTKCLKSMNVFFDPGCVWCFIFTKIIKKSWQAWRKPYLSHHPKQNLPKNIPIRWRSFPLFSTIESRKGTNLAKRFQSSSKQQQCLEYITAYAKKYNIDFCYNAIIEFPHTFHMHLLIQQTQSKNPEKTTKLVEAFFDAWFIKNQDTSKQNILDAIMIEQNLDAIIDPAEALTQMEIDYDMAQRLRLPNIPCAVIDNHYILPGICEQKSYFPFFTLMLAPSFDGAEA